MGCKQIRASVRQTPLAALCTSLCRARLMRSQQEMRALGKGHGVDFALKMTFKCLKPGEDAAYPGPTVEGKAIGTGSTCSPHSVLGPVQVPHCIESSPP